MNCQKEYELIYTALQQSLALGLFKQFSDVAAVVNALEAIRRELSQKPDEGE